MRRTATYLCTILLLTLCVSGCKSTDKQADAYAMSGSTDTYGWSEPESPLVEETGDTTDPYLTYSAETADDLAYTTEATGPRYHTVAKKETLYSLARHYYKDERRWKDIYNANRAKIDDPNKIFVGQRLLIP